MVADAEPQEACAAREALRCAEAVLHKLLAVDQRSVGVL